MKTLRKLGLTALTAACLSFQAIAAPTALDRIIATVNDDVILASEFNQRYELVRAQLAGRNQRIPPDNILRSQIMDRLIIDNLMLQLAEQQGIRVTDRQLNDAINNIASRNGMTLAQFRDALIAEGQDFASAREQIKREMLIAQVQQSNVSRRIKVTDQEVKNFLSTDTNQADQSEILLSIILVALPEEASPEQIQQAEQRAQQLLKELKQGADFAEVAIAASSDPTALNGGDLGWRRTTELPDSISTAISKLKKGDISNPIRTPSGFYLVQYRDKRGGAVQLEQQVQVRHILLKPSEIRSPEQTQRLINRLHERIKQGEPFEVLAKELSDDLGSGSEGGALGWASPGQMVPEFEQVMMSTPVGEVSQPFESRFGWHILEVLDRRNQDVGDQVKESQARATISKRKFSEELANWLREVRSEAYVEIRQ